MAGVTLTQHAMAMAMAAVAVAVAAAAGVKVVARRPRVVVQVRGGWRIAVRHSPRPRQHTAVG